MKYLALYYINVTIDSGTNNTPIVLIPRWYHGAIDRATACQRLERIGKPGAYLVRESRSERGLVLSFLDRDNRFHHFMIVRRSGRYNIGGNIWFSSLSKLLGFHSKYSSVVERHSERLDVCVPPPQVRWEGMEILLGFNR